MRAYCNSCRATFDVKEDLVDQELLCRLCGATVKQSFATEPSAHETKTAGDVQVLDSSPGDDVFLMAEIFDATESTDQPQPSARRSSNIREPHRSAGMIAFPNLPLQTMDLSREIVGSIRPVAMTLQYRLALSLVALVMVLLPLLYVGLILLIAYGTYWHTLNHTGILRWKNQDGREGWYAMFYIAPIVAGVILLIFMIKPLFAWPTRREQLHSLKREEQPNLFRFIDRLCEAVHSPRPKRIAIDCEVNASASIGGGIRSLWGNDLVLTIGLPLVAGLSAKEFAGILAHEFGHFTQGFGMWMSYLIRSINAWFMRIVYQRDTWDVWLEKSAKIIDVRIAIVLHFARFMIWLTRRILWLFSFFGQLVSCYLLRQMEYDADLHECRLSGSKTFESTSKKMRYLAIAYQQSIADLNTFLLDGKLGDDFPMMIIFNRDQQEPTLREKIESLGTDEKTEWLATHPCDRDRIAAAQRENAPGIFAVDHPATVLFERFEEVCKEATTSFLQAALADAFKLQMLVPLPQLLAQKIELRDANIALERMMGVRLQRAMALPFPDHLELTVHNSQEAVNHLTDARQYMIDHFDEYTNAMKQMDRMHSDWLACYQAIALLELGIKPNEKDFRIPVNSVSVARQEQQELSERIQQELLTLRPFHTNMVTRFRAAHWLLLHPQSLETIEAGESTQTLSLNALETLVAINDQVSHVNTLHNWFSSFSTFLSVMQGQELTRTIYTRLTDMAETLCQKMSEITQLLNVHPFPFEHADGAMDLATYLFPKKPNNQDFLEVAHATYSFIEQFHYLYFRCLGSMALVVQRVETAWKLPLQPDPIRSFNDDEAPSKGS